MSRSRTDNVDRVDSIAQVVNSGIRSPVDEEDLPEYLERLDLLAHGFAYRELVNGSRRHRKPPRKFWPNLALTLRLAIEFRSRAIEEAGVRGLKVAAAYRPIGGASRSAHKWAKALDLDRIGGDSIEYYRCAARLWSDLGQELDAGLGLYTWRTKSLGGLRVHWDTNHGLRTWQHVYARGSRRPWEGLPLSRKLVADMGLPDPITEKRNR